METLATVTATGMDTVAIQEMDHHHMPTPVATITVTVMVTDMAEAEVGVDNPQCTPSAIKSAVVTEVSCTPGSLTLDMTTRHFWRSFTVSGLQAHEVASLKLWFATDPNLKTFCFGSRPD